MKQKLPQSVDPNQWLHKRVVKTKVINKAQQIKEEEKD